MVHPRFHPTRRTLLAGDAGSLPSNLPSLKLWLDASDSSSITLAGSDLTTWNDKSGTGNHLTEATNRPSIATAQQNGLDGVYFDGTGEMMSKSSPIGLGNFGTFSAYIVCSNEDENNICFSVGVYDIDGGDACWAFTKQTQERHQLWVVTGSTAFSRTAPTDKGAEGAAYWGSGVFEENVGRAAWVEESTSSATANFPLESTADLTIGDANATGYEPWKGHIYEVLFYGVAHDTATRESVQNYLKAKWNV